MKTYGLGGKRSQINTTNGHHIASSTSLPSSIDYRPLLKPVRDQGSEPTCVGQTFACIKEWQEHKQVGFSEYMSPQFIYNLRQDKSIDGMSAFNGCNVLIGRGCCSEYNYHYGRTDPIPVVAYDEAAKYKIVSCAQVNTINGLKQSLLQNGPAAIMFPCYNYTADFWNKHPGDPDEPIDGHCVACVGYDSSNGFILRNSWGSSWNHTGYTIYPYTDFGHHWEIWTTIDSSSPAYKPNSPYDPNNKSSCCIIT